MASRDELLAEIRERLLQAQAVMTKCHNEQHRDVEFSVGQWVWLRLQHRAATSITGLSPSKLGPRFYGPCQVVERICSVAYRLNLPAKAKIHNMFHVVHLKEFRGEPPTELIALPPIHQRHKKEARTEQRAA